MRRLPILLVSLASLFSCTSTPDGCQTLPVLGERDIRGGDTLFHTIPPFRFIDQDSQVVTKQTFAGDLYVADFFFISCPTICPKVKQQMLRIYEEFADEPPTQAPLPLH